MFKARPTTYRGIKMRSRLEARFAAYLDQEGDPWEYEPRAFANERGQYLPDFRVQIAGTDTVFYIEVKPTVELALPALERMAIILDSEPEVFLQAVVPGIGCFTSRPARRRWSFLRSPTGLGA